MRIISRHHAEWERGRPGRFVWGNNLVIAREITGIKRDENGPHGTTAALPLGVTSPENPEYVAWLYSKRTLGDKPWITNSDSDESRHGVRIVALGAAQADVYWLA